MFVGPTLAADQIETEVEITLRPPASRGDIYLAAGEEPQAILLIDGAFEDVPAVFHKEILWALNRGIHVFGASSLGALRAAELDAFGMIGIGLIYEGYKNGQLQRDDAVAVLHGPSELGWPLLTRALVDIQATLLEAQKQSVIDLATKKVLEAAASNLFWRERTYEKIVDRALKMGWRGDARSDFLSWVAESEVSQKHRDAVALIEHVTKNWSLLETPFQPNFRFENTAAWQSLVVDIAWKRCGISRDEFEQISMSLRDSGEYEALELAAMVLTLADDEIQEYISPLEDLEFPYAAKEFRRKHGLTQELDVANWLDGNGISHSEYMSFVADHYKLTQLRERMSSRLRHAILRVLRGKGRLPS